MTAKELNKKIEELEKRIKDLENRQPIINVYQHQLPIYPQLPINPPWSPWSQYQQGTIC